MTTYRIKPLEWIPDKSIYDSIAPTTFGVFRIYVNPNTAIHHARFDSGGRAEWIGHNHQSFSEAASACTAHWESLLKQALEEV